MSAVAESTLEQAALDWFKELGYAIKYGPEIAEGELFTFNEVLVVSDGLEARFGSLTADREWFLP